MATVVLHLIIQSNSLPVQCSLLAGLVYLTEVILPSSSFHKTNPNSAVAVLKTQLV
jgi:hypothetical protein